MGLFDGVKNFFGQQPGAIASGGQVGASGSGGGLGLLQQAPVQGPSTSFLDRLKSPDERGLTFGDKLFAAGAVAQGDSGGAASYLQNQRTMHDTLTQRTKQEDMAKAGMEALRGNIRPDGSLDFQGYLGALPKGADPAAALSMRNDMRQKITPMSGSRGSMYGFNQDTGQFIQGVGPTEPEEPPKFIKGPNGNMMPNPVYGQYAEMVARGERSGKPLAPQRPRVGRAPKSWGANDVTWGSPGG